jgi:L-ribulokinase
VTLSADLVVGVDFGTLSARALVVRVHDGEELGSAASAYTHGVLDRTLPNGSPLPPQWALQCASDYLRALAEVVPAAIRDAGVRASDVIGIAIDFTACTILPTNDDGTPLSELDEFADEPHAYVKLWKHHAAQGQADRINATARRRGEGWLSRYGGRISSEWEFAKGLQLLEEAPDVYSATAHFVEAADWIVWQLSGRLTRNVSTAGYKGLYQDGAYPSSEFLAELNPAFANFVSAKIDRPLVQLGERVGSLTRRAAELTGLVEGIAIAAGNVDAHVTVPAAGALESGTLVAIMGTSTCHVMNGDSAREVPGMCGVVRGGIAPGLWGYEAGQSGVGDIFNWFVTTQVPPQYCDRAAAQGLTIHEYLTELASHQQVGEHGLLALDWHSGNRSVLVDHDLSGLIVGLTLRTRPEEIYRALLEATAFGTRVIIEAFREAGVAVRRLVAAGGLLRNPHLMQIYADVTNLPIMTIGSEQGPALGAAIHAAVAAGSYPDVWAASAAMGSVGPVQYVPAPARAGVYDAMFGDYLKLHDYFGRGVNDVMHELKRRQRAALAQGDEDS